MAKAECVTDEEKKYYAEHSALVKEKYGCSMEDLHLKYSNQMNHIVRNVLLFFYPGLLQKRLIVFTTNFRNNHWEAAFVFNAGDIVAATECIMPPDLFFFAIAVFIPLAGQKFQTM